VYVHSSTSSFIFYCDIFLSSLLAVNSKDDVFIRVIFIFLHHFPSLLLSCLLSLDFRVAFVLCCSNHSLYYVALLY